jgi:lipid A ethanolaminephosphotransferase
VITHAQTLPRPARRTFRGIEHRAEVGTESLAFVASVFFAAFSNVAFWRTVVATGALHGPGGWLTAASLFTAITALNMIVLCVLLNRWTAKPVLTVLLLVTAVAAHFMTQYTVYFDADMIRNILHTDGKESTELVSLGLVPPLLVYGLLPACLLWRVRLRRRTAARALLVRCACLVGAALVAAGAIALSFQDISSLVRNHREVRYLVTPGNYLVSLVSVALDDRAGKDQPRLPVGTDARVLARPATAKRRLLVLVVGETVRAQNWGLNGYARQTTPELAKIAPINFPDVTACGSATEVSVPCMFSPYGRAHYDKQRIEHSESVLHVFGHAGIKVLWRDNQTGCKGVCEGLAFESFERGTDPRYCTDEGCLDNAMLAGLGAEVARQPGDVVVVLHQIGNHGPAYYRRYPADLRRFAPACGTGELGRCSRAEIVNAYDNAVLQTDDFLARTIRFLAEQDGRDTALVYVSDHGESLGENGLYLHGVPYAIAPDTQLKVPMVVWLSPGFAVDRGVDLACMRREAKRPASHDNLFHSMLGLMQVQTSAYEPRLDLFRPCSSGASGTPTPDA